MKTDYELLEQLTEIHADAAMEFRSEDLAFIMGRRTCERLCALTDSLHHFGPTQKHEDNRLFGCPVYVTRGAGVLCVGRQSLFELLYDVEKAIYTERKESENEDK